MTREAPTNGPRRDEWSFLLPPQRARLVAVRRAILAQHLPDLLLGDPALAALPDARDLLRDRERLRLQELAEQQLLGLHPLRELADLRHLLVHRGQVVDAVGLQPLEQRVAVPGGDDRSDGVGPG